MSGKSEYPFDRLDRGGVADNQWRQGGLGVLLLELEDWQRIGTRTERRWLTPS